MAKTLTPLETESQLGTKLGPLPRLSENNPNNYSCVVTIKEENEDELGLGLFEEELGIFGKIGGISGSVSASKRTKPQQEEEEEGGELGVPRAFEMLHGLGPPPFLTKTYEMVENPETDEIISWGSSGGGTSFVVWDPHKFSTDLLPKFFKHSNFSSFVRQLNTYGFRKVHLGRWEFANAAFQRGKKHLLRSIKRKYHNDKSNLRLKFQTEAEIEKLKLEQEALKVEIRDLKQQQLNSKQYLATLEERMKSAEWKQRQFLLFIAKAMKKAPLFQQLLQNYQEKKALDNGQVSKKRRLASHESPDDSTFTDLSQTPGCIHEDGMADIELEANSLLGSSPVDLGPRPMQEGQEQSSSFTSETSPDLSTGSYIMWEKLLEDDVVCEGDEEAAFANDQTKFVHELEDLIAKPPAWGSFANAGEVACPGGQ